MQNARTSVCGDKTDFSTGAKKKPAVEIPLDSAVAAGQEAGSDRSLA
ncbi:MAG: hypothetical protein H0X40_15660 [Chthoniobacterales bacterium]|nr:hypothetical protein [Chthoniobacterales bacterium]